MSFQWQVTPQDAFGGLAANYVAAIRQAVGLLAQRWAPTIEAWMKQEAVWQDHTGNARQTLHSEVEGLGTDMITIILAHGMSYGIYLELSHGGRFSVIGPALDHFGPLIWQDVVALFA
jgi:hypothetical protein